MNRRKIIFGLLSLLLVFQLLPLYEAKAIEVPAPTILDIDTSGEFSSRPLMTGLTKAGTDVMVFINGTFNRNALVEDSGTDTDSWFWRPVESLPIGRHIIFTIARDRATAIMSPRSEEIEIVIEPLSAPTLFEPDGDTATGNPKPPITGVTVSGTVVHVFIDGIINGNTGLLTDDSGTASFAYTPFLNLSVGEHTAWTIAQDESGHKSTISNVLKFNIEDPLPAPTLLDAVVNNTTSFNKPLITGLAKNGQRIQVFIDDVLNGEFEVENDESGTANFAYQPFSALSAGWHKAYTRAIDEEGKVSQSSNTLEFDVRRPGAIGGGVSDNDVPAFGTDEFWTRLSDIMVLARLFRLNSGIVVTPGQIAFIERALEDPASLNLTDEEIQYLEDLLEAKKREATEEEVIVEGEELVPQDGEVIPEEPTATSTGGSALEEIEEILEGGEGETADKAGLINEEKEQQGKLKLNLAIFILFLIAVIVWIFWVNRELIKERREENAGKDNNKDSGPTPPPANTDQSNMPF